MHDDQHKPHRDLTNTELLGALSGVIVSSLAASTTAILNALHSTEGKIMATQAQLAAGMTAVADQLGKAITEITTAIAAAGNSTPEVDAALTRLQAAAQALDDLNPDTPPTP